jgi:hypothetical protein
MAQTFFYDEQIRRFLLQFTRMISNFQIEYGKDDTTGQPTLLRVPVRYGDSSRQAQTILQNNSANSLPSAPLMTFYITNLEYARDRVQEPYHINKMQVRQRTWDPDSETYETTQGNAFTIERPMPVPYNLKVNLDIWTTNTNQKLQLLEQLLILFNPALEIQSTDNYIDWTSLSVVELIGQTWSSRSIPMGTENPIDICTLQFEMPIWISAPSRVTKLGVVEKIVASIYDANGDMNNALTDNDILLGTRMEITPYGYQVLLIGNQLQVLKPSDIEAVPNTDLAPPTSPGSNESWQTVINLYGTLRPGISQIRLEVSNEVEIVGTIAFHPADERFLLYTIDTDTLPQNTVSPINAVINPLRSGPGAGLPVAALGQRYLLTESTGNIDNQVTAQAWAGTLGAPLIANANDIVEFDGTRWIVTFDSAVMTDVEYVTNITTSLQYKWTGSEWLRSYEGLYPGGNWKLVL